MSHSPNDTTALGVITTTAQPWWRGSSFPYSQYKDLMPEDQFAKLLAMHENSAANAALYVAVVLAVYLVLLSLLLCRYMRRRPPIRELPLPSLPTPSDVPRPGPTFLEMLLSCMTKPYDAVRHCTLRSGAGVASISSEENDEERSGHGSRRDSTVIRMNQLRPHSSSFDGKPQPHMVNVCVEMDHRGDNSFQLGVV